MEEDRIISKIIHESKIGLSITEIVQLTQLSRSAVRIILARLEGANKVNIRKIGMAKVYILNSCIEKNIHNIETDTEHHSTQRAMNTIK